MVSLFSATGYTVSVGRKASGLKLLKDVEQPALSALPMTFMMDRITELFCCVHTTLRGWGSRHFY